VSVSAPAGAVGDLPQRAVATPTMMDPIIARAPLT
jgi:hypothetical protein